MPEVICGDRSNSINETRRLGGMSRLTSEIFSLSTIRQTSSKQQRRIENLLTAAITQGRTSCRTVRTWVTLCVQGCKPKKIRQKVCVGQCASAYFPSAVDVSMIATRANSTVIRSPCHGQLCQMCAPSKEERRRIQLRCSGKRKVVYYKRIKKCTCNSCPCGTEN